MSTSDEFAQITAGVFRAEELAEVERRAAHPLPYTVELLSPGRDELLGCFQDLLGRKLEAALAEDFKLLSLALTEIAFNRLGIQRNAELRVLGACSLICEDGVVVPDQRPVMGRVFGFRVERWYDIASPEDASAEPPALSECYSRIGPMVMLSETVVECADGTLELVGDALLPLEHGEPQLYTVLRPE